MPKTKTPTKWLTPEQVAERYQLPVPTLYQWRYNGYGPVAVRIGRHLRYDLADIEAFEAQLRAREAGRRGA